MSVEPVQVYHAETPVAQPRARVPAAVRPGRSEDSSGGPMTPRDAVVVSDQARKLAAAGAGADAPHLQLDFKQLRELAFNSQPNPSAGSSE
jgi:hypothetical protein